LALTPDFKKIKARKFWSIEILLLVILIFLLNANEPYVNCVKLLKIQNKPLYITIAIRAAL
jgi:hypothetical protein